MIPVQQKAYRQGNSGTQHRGQQPQPEAVYRAGRWPTGKNQYGNHWNTARPESIQICAHAFIGRLADSGVATYQTLSWDMVGWHSGAGSLGSAKNANNTGYIGFEICEDGLTDNAYFHKVYTEAVELCAYLCKEYALDPEVDIICHSEGHGKGIAFNHADVMYWFPKHGKSMDTFRAEVKAAMSDADEGSNAGNENSGTVADGMLYGVVRQVIALSDRERVEQYARELNAKGEKDAFYKVIEIVR